VVGESEEAAVIRPASDNYAAALAAADVDFVYQVHSGYHDWNNFRREFRDAVDWGLFEPVAENPTTWANDTVATRGELWGFGYRFDAPPDRVVRFSRAGDQLSISAAGSPVNVTTPGDCAFHLQTPAVIKLPRKPCAKLAVRVRPRHLRTGRRSRLRVTVAPAVAGTVVRVGRHHAGADAAGVADLRLCAGTARPLKVRARTPGFDAAGAVARVRGPNRACR
jgi:hypothetical protein